MERLHARYPFLGASRAAVQSAGVDLAEVVRGEGPAVERGYRRVRRALVEGTTAPEERWPTRPELLSYPVARVMVSLLDVPGAVEKYARAEAALARQRFGEDFEREIRTGRDERLTLERLLADFDLSSAVTRAPPTEAGRNEAEDGEQFHVDVTAYLPLSADLDGKEWRLVTRELASGRVPIDREELYTLLREAVRRRVAEELPLDVPEEVAAPLDAEVGQLREALAEVELSGDIDTVVPGLFPPCMRALLSRAQSDGLGALPDHSRFALVTFLASSGLDAEGMMELCSVGDPATGSALREQVARVRGEASHFAPPGCEAMVAYGDCVNRDDLCETIAHPLEYYEERLGSAPAERLVDWRET